MKKNKKTFDSLCGVIKIFEEEHKKLTARNELKSLARTYGKLYKAACEISSSSDYRFNAIHWAIDVMNLINEIQYSFCWLIAYAKGYIQKVKEESRPSHTNFFINYFAANCITRINSARDKLSLMIWAYFVPFNPEKKSEILTFSEIIERLKCPVKFSLKIRKHEQFYASLKELTGSDFTKIEQYRHLKIHRREPRIEIYGIRDHHDWPYIFILDKEEDINKWEDDLTKQYPNKVLREAIKKSSYRNNALFTEKVIKNRMWNYKDLEKVIEGGLLKLVKSTDECYKILRKRIPFNKK